MIQWQMDTLCYCLQMLVAHALVEAELCVFSTVSNSQKLSYQQRVYMNSQDEDVKGSAHLSSLIPFQSGSSTSSKDSMPYGAAASANAAMERDVMVLTF